MLTITSIAVTNFRGIRQLSLTSLPRRVFLVGPNGAGKTSVLNALQVTLYGRVFDREGKNLRVARYVGPHGREASVEVGLDLDGRPMTAVWTANSRETSMEVKRPGQASILGSPREVRKALWAIVDAQQAHAECAGNPQAYLAGQDLGALLAGLSAAPVDIEALRPMLGDKAKWFEEYLKQNGLALRDRADLEKIGKSVYGARTALNKDLADRKDEIMQLSKVAPPTTAKGQTLTPANMPEIYRNIEVLKKERDALVEERGAAKTALRDDEVQAMRMQVNQLDGDIAHAQEAFEQAETMKTEADARLARLKETESEGQRKIAANDLALRTAKAALQKCGDGEKCPFCGKKLSAAAVEKLIMPLHAQHDEAEKEHEVLASFAEATAREVEEARKEAREADEHFKEVRVDLETAKGEKAILEAKLAAAGRPTGRSAQECDDAIEALDTRIGTAQAALTALQSLQRSEDLSEPLPALYNELQYLEWAVEQFEKGAMANALGADGRETFLQTANAQLSQFSSLGALDVHVDGKNLQLLLGATPVTEVSDGEFILACLGVGKAFSDDGRCPIIVDGLDRLDGNHKSEFWGALSETKGSVFLAGAYGLNGPPDIDAMEAGLAAFDVRPVWIDQNHREAVA